MTEDITKDLTADEKLNLILSELADLREWRAGVDVRLAKVEAFVDDRSRDTRPMLDLIHKEVADTRVEMRDRFDLVEDRLARTAEDAKGAHRLARLLHDDLLRARADHEELRERVADVERKIA